MQLHELWRRLHDRTRRDTLSAELDEELRFHRAQLERDGDSPARLGNITHLKEETRSMWTLGWLDDLLLDVRYAARVLRRDAIATTAIIATLALGIGANAALFAVVNAVLLRSLPYGNPDRLVSIWTAPVGSPNDRNPSSYPDLNDWRTMSHSFESIGAVAFNRYELTGAEGTDAARAAVGTRDLATVLNARPVLGRMPTPDDERDRVVTISHRLWMNRYHGASDVVGRTVALSEQPFTIIGVMPAGFHYPTPDIDLWTSFAPIAEPGAPASAPARDNPWITSRSVHAYRVVGRLRAGVTLAAAEAELNDIQRRLARMYPDDRGVRLHVEAVSADAVRDVRRPLWIMLGAASVLLVLACVNIAHLTLVRTAARAREIAVRRALGANRGRVARQLLSESLLLGLAGGAVGVVVAVFATGLFIRLSPSDVPRLETVHVDGATLLFALAASLVTTVLFGLTPTVLTWRADLQSPLREHGRGAGTGVGVRLRDALTAIEVAFALMLLIGGGLMVRSFVAVSSVDLGVRTAHTVSFSIGLPKVRYADNTSRVTAVDRMLSGVRALAGVVDAGAATSLPPIRIQQISGFSIDGDPAPEVGHQPEAIYIPATPGFITALSIPLDRGRRFDVSDDAKAQPVAIITRGVAQRYFKHHDPLGRLIQLEGATRRIVGVVGDAVYQGATTAAVPQIYVPFAQASFPGVWFAVKTNDDASATLAQIRDVIHSVDPRLDPRELRTMDDVVSDSVVRPRFQAWLLGAFGLLALALAASGIYGIVAYGVARRTAEIGVRVALGATPASIVGLVLREGLTAVLVGLAIGLIAASLGARALTGLLYGVAPVDAFTYAGVSGILVAVAAAASLIPARRAARVDPMTALRNA
ncbi:MAG TPA: ABC transporter permease [Gemmatimonadaceae bacterium]|jgi:putative ABC transport system permease protein